MTHVIATNIWCQSISEKSTPSASISTDPFLHFLIVAAGSRAMKRIIALILSLVSAQTMAEVKVDGVQYTAAAQSSRLVLSFTGLPSYKVFTLENPPRIVIDLSDARLTSTLPKVNPRNGLARGLRSGIRHSHDLRMVLEVNENVTAGSTILQPSNNRGYRLVIDLVLPGAAPPAAHETALAATDTPPAPNAEVFAQLMEDARQSMAKNDYGRAIALYTKILEYPDHAYRQDAQEFLGLARERNGQLAHAKAEYETYLQLYPEGEGAARVRQRLTGMLTAQAPAREKLPEEKPREIPASWNVRGGFSQYYRRDVSTTDAAGTSVNQSELDTDIDVIAQMVKPDYQMQGRFTAGYRNDFIDGSFSNPLRISSLYVDASDSHRKTLGRIGRQSQSRGGVLGRFDGLLLSRQLNPTVKLNLVSGYPVDSSTIDKIATDTQFYGINADLGTFANAWDFNVFAIEQTSEGLLDRRAVGGEMRYFQTNHSVLGLADYDVSYQTLNMILLLGNWLFVDNTALNLVYDQRKSPILTTRNALIGQTDAALTALAQHYTEDQIRALARDRSADSHSYTASLAHPLGNKLQIGGDITLSILSSTPTSGGVDAMPASGNDWSYSLQIMGNDLVKIGDIAIIAVRRNTNTTSDTTSLNLNTRYPIDQAWRINPRLLIDHRHFATDGSTQWTTSPSVRVNYMWRRDFNLEFEAGGEWSSRDTAGTTDKTTGYYLSIGYRADF
jgi:AMIN domain